MDASIAPKRPNEIQRALDAWKAAANAAPGGGILPAQVFPVDIDGVGCHMKLELCATAVVAVPVSSTLGSSLRSATPALDAPKPRPPSFWQLDYESVVETDIEIADVALRSKGSVDSEADGGALADAAEWIFDKLVAHLASSMRETPEHRAIVEARLLGASTAHAPSREGRGPAWL